MKRLANTRITSNRGLRSQWATIPYFSMQKKQPGWKGLIWCQLWRLQLIACTRTSKHCTLLFLIGRHLSLICYSKGSSTSMLWSIANFSISKLMGRKLLLWSRSQTYSKVEVILRQLTGTMISRKQLWLKLSLTLSQMKLFTFQIGKWVTMNCLSPKVTWLTTIRWMIVSI